jgi:hypothetical protein
MPIYVVGDVIQPYAGGGDYGRCVFCDKPGLRVVELPIAAANKPKGWAKIPTE